MSDGSDVKVEVLGHDRGEYWRKVKSAIAQSIEEQRPVQAEERERQAREASYNKRDDLYFRCERFGALWRAECIAGLPGWISRVYADGMTPDEAVHEARFGFAQALYKAKLCPTWEAARARAANATLHIADKVG